MSKSAFLRHCFVLSVLFVSALVTGAPAKPNTGPAPGLSGEFVCRAAAGWIQPRQVRAKLTGAGAAALNGCMEMDQDTPPANLPKTAGR